MNLDIIFRGKQVTCEIIRLDAGIHVLLTGGDRSHIGAWSMAQPDSPVQTTQLPGHRDGEVSERWAELLSRATGETVFVVCGIHYDNLSREELTKLLGLLKDLEQKAEKALSAQSHASGCTGL